MTCQGGELLVTADNLLTCAIWRNTMNVYGHNRSLYGHSINAKDILQLAGGEVGDELGYWNSGLLEPPPVLLSI